jgi:hypothetical protein
MVGWEALRVKKGRSSYRADRRESVKIREPRRGLQQRDAEDIEAANVRYFLHALNQMSLALQALGYVKEGAALVKVKADLKNRLFHSSDKLANVARLPH